MKLTLDTQSKTIEIDGEINLAELNKELKSMFPKDWDKFKICSKSKEYVPYYPFVPFNNPIINPQPYFYEPYKVFPFEPTIICGVNPCAGATCESNYISVSSDGIICNHNGNVINKGS